MVAWLTVKSVAIFLGLASTAFCVATIVLAVQNADLENDLQDALDKIDALTADTTSTSTSTSTTTTTTADPNRPTDDPSGTTSSPGEGGVTTPSGGSSPGETSPGGESSSTASTSSSSAPIYPTLPTGLPDPDKIEWRLPTELTPIKYKVFIQPNLKTGECKGDVSIQFQLNAVTNLIVLHAKDLNVHSISILNMMARIRVAIDSVVLDAVREIILINLREVLSLNKAFTLSASFDCNLNNLVGSYISNYTNAEGVET